LGPIADLPFIQQINTSTLQHFSLAFREAADKNPKPCRTGMKMCELVPAWQKNLLGKQFVSIRKTTNFQNRNEF
ncbi:MAG: hypothetical protein AAGM67_02550, partial [Bacteroidota bacterium]